jgi:hypothetical protein
MQLYFINSTVVIQFDAVCMYEEVIFTSILYGPTQKSNLTYISISRQGSKCSRATIEKCIARSVFYVVRAMSIARRRVAKHIPAEANARKNRTCIARQLRGKHAFATVEEAVFSMCPPQDYISSPVANQKSVVERKREWSESSAVTEEGFG